MNDNVLKDSENREYVAVPVSQFKADKVLCADIYLHINEKFIKFKHEGDELESEKIDYFIEKNVKDIYVLKDNLIKVIEWLKNMRKEVIQEVVDEVGEEYIETVEKTENIREKVLDTFADLELDSGVVELLQDQVDDFIEHIQAEKIPSSIIAKLTSHSESMADHAMNVANVSLYISLLLGHGNGEVLSKLYMGALLHDYGKMKIPKEVLENKQNLKYNQAIQDHPRKGSKIASKIPDVPPEVIKIIEQHHEQFNGNGFPAGLKNHAIFGLAKIVQIANIFDNAVMENKHKPKKEKYRAALKVLDYDNGKQFDPDMIKKISEGMWLAFGHMYKPPSKDNA